MNKVILKEIDNNSKYNEKYFKQLIIYDNFKQINTNFDKNNIKIINSKLNIAFCKIIDTIEGTSFEGQYLSGKKLVIIGNICTKIFIEYINNCNLKCYYITKEIPFSTFIIIPKDICKQNDINLEYSIEDISFANINKEKLFISITLLIQYKSD